MGPFRLPPDGAVREYAPDAAWKQRFLDLSQSAKYVIALGSFVQGTATRRIRLRSGLPGFRCGDRIRRE
jgi:hypothetical protein